MAHDLPKPALRQRLRALRNALPPAARQAWSDAITARLIALPQLAQARSVFCYVSVGSEPDTRALLRRLLAAGRQVAVPQILAPGVMIAQPIRSLDELVPGPLGILAPPATAPDSPGLPAVDVAIVPGLAFTAAGDRLGLGAGYYDRWLAAHPATLSLGLCFPPLLVPELPIELHDVKVAQVISA